ncbi:MAG: c-type cytochrome [Acidimicrobiia bacterium]
MSDLSAAAAAALGVPEALIQRSAAARAAETGMSVDDVLAAWAGGGSVVGAPATPSEAEPTEAADVTPEVAETPQPVGEAEPETTPAATTTAPSPGVVTRSPSPATVTAAEAASMSEVVTVPTAGIRERTNFSMPRWLAAVLLIIPAFALFALGGSATGSCGSATELKADVITGDIVNCDGSAFTGSGAGGGGTNFLADGEALYNAAPDNCAGCHGPTGGGGVGPALTGVLTTFGACADHEEWVTLGTNGFREAGRSTYGDSGKTVGGGGVMPTFGTTLSAEQIASVVAFERVRFGGADPDQTLLDCGLVEAPAQPGAPAPDGSGGDTTTTTAPGASASLGSDG